MHRRLVHLQKRKILQLDENALKSNSQLIEELKEAVNDGNLSLKLPVAIPGCRHGDKFRGAHFEMDAAIALKIARGEENPLAGYVDQDRDIQDNLEFENEE